MTLPEHAATYNTDGKPVLLKRGEMGYFPMPDWFNVEAFNESHAITENEVKAMTMGSMFGWDIPAADPENYDDE